MRSFLLIFAIALACTACGQQSPAERYHERAKVAAAAAPVFQIVGQDWKAPHKHTVCIRLEKPASEQDLTNIAWVVRGMQEKDYATTYVFYYLPDMDINGAAWATSHFDPELAVHIQGNSAEELATLKAAPATASADLVGSWSDTRPGVANRIDIIRDGAGYLVTRTFAGETAPSISEKATVKERPLGREFHVEDEPAAKFMRINSAGELEAHDADGLIFKAKKVGS